MAERAPAWVPPLMRSGYTALGIVYLIVGALTATSAWSGGGGQDTKSALSTLAGQTWGVALLWVIAVGLVAYGVWRVVNGWLDLEEHGADAKGVIARIGLFVTGLIHFGLAISAARIALGGGSSGGEGGGKVQSWTAMLMSEQFGRWLVVAIGLVTIGAGVYIGVKGVREKYKEHLLQTPTMENLSPVCQFGLIAHGVVVALIGGFIGWAGWTSDSSDAGGLGQAFETIRNAPFGAILLTIVGVGMVGYAVYCFIEAVYRILPSQAGGDVRTLASKAKAEAKRAAA